MATTTIILYLAFLSQIILLSYYYPSKFLKRAMYVQETYPPAEYPKLYPGSFGHDSAANFIGGFTSYKILNGLAFIIGLALLGWAIFTGYTPKETGGEETIVMLYAMIQAIPNIRAEIAAHEQLKAMRNLDKSSKRVADLSPRKLFDFVSPIAVLLAATLFISWLVVFIMNEGPIAEWKSNVYISLSLLSVVHIGYAIATKRAIHGKKLDPYQATKDQLKAIETKVKMYVYSLIFVNLFLLVNTAIEISGREVFDPIAMTIYFQLLVACVMELLFRVQKIELTDFEVYREASSQ